MRCRRLLHAAAAGAACALIAANAAQAQTLGISGNRFTVDGSPRFLVFVSYFDSMDVSEGNAYNDFSHFRAWGIDGIRIFPNWWTRNPNTYAGDTVIAPDGSIRESSFWNMVWYLDRAREYGLLVDISFSAESVAWLCGTEDCPANEPWHADLSFDEALNGIREVAARLAGPNYRHVLFDIQNESNIIGPFWNRLEDWQVGAIVNAIKSVDPSRIVTASVDQNMSTQGVGHRANATGQDVATWHEPRWQDWWNNTFWWVQEIRSTTGKPIYLQEPERFRPGENDSWFTASGLRRAAEEAKKGCAAAWTFHTSAGFYMNQTSFLNQLWGMEWDLLSSVKGHLDGVTWCQ